MKLISRFFTNLGGYLGATFIRQWMRTLEYKCAFYDPAVDPVNPDYSGQKIYIFWHEYILFPIYLRGNCNLSMLLSTHRDADILARTAYHLGFDFVRGSTFRGGVSALRSLMEKSRDMNLTITPDGPRGPRRKLAQGPIYLASKLNLPIVAMGFGYDRPWRFNSWDRFALPRPLSRARAVVSPALNIPTDLDREGVEHYRREVEWMLNRLTLEAEAWAESGTRKVSEVPLLRQSAPKRIHRIDAAETLHGPHRPQESINPEPPATALRQSVASNPSPLAQR